MRTVIFLAVMMMAFTAKSQTIDNPVVLKSFDKDQDLSVWYTSRRPDEDNIRMIMYATDGNEDYYRYVLELFDFDADNGFVVDGVVKIWEDDNYTIRVIEKKRTIISVIEH